MHSMVLPAVAHTLTATSCFGLNTRFLLLCCAICHMALVEVVRAVVDPVTHTPTTAHW